MRMSDIKTIDELRDFAKGETFYSVDDNFPFGINAHLIHSSNLRLEIDKGGAIFWAFGSGQFSSFSTCELFDNEREAEMLSLINRIEYLDMQLRKTMERLAELEKSSNPFENVDEELVVKKVLETGRSLL